MLPHSDRSCRSSEIFTCLLLLMLVCRHTRLQSSCSNCTLVHAVLAVYRIIDLQQVHERYGHTRSFLCFQPSIDRTFISAADIRFTLFEVFSVASEVPEGQWQVSANVPHPGIRDSRRRAFHIRWEAWFGQGKRGTSFCTGKPHRRDLA